MYRNSVIGPFTAGVSVQIKRLLGSETAGERIDPRDARSVSYEAPDLRKIERSKFDLEFFDLGLFQLRLRDPLLHRRPGEDPVAIGSGSLRRAARHRCESASRPAHTWRRPSKSFRIDRDRREPRAFAPDLGDAGDVALRLGPNLEVRKMGLEIHRQRRAQRGEARMNLAANGAAACALHAVRRQKPRFRRDLVKEFPDRERVPNLHPS